jgi:probable F420-dependent oxidoreductase
MRADAEVRMGGGRRPFRFGVIGEAITTRERLLDTAQRAQALGYSTLLLRDHFVPEPFGEQLAPLVALTAAAGATRALRVGSLVLDNDYRHPVVLAKEAATLNLLSEGRFELGIGAGWLRDEYEQAGIPFDPPAVRVGRLEESLQVLKRLLAGPALTFKGEHYTVDGIAGFPVPVQRPHPPILVGAGSRRMLGIAGREADIVGILPRALPEGTISGELSERSPERVARKVDWVQQAAQDRSRQVELSMVLSIALGHDPGRRPSGTRSSRAGAPPRASWCWRCPRSSPDRPTGSPRNSCTGGSGTGCPTWWWPTATWRPSRPWSSTWRDGDAVTRSHPTGR